MIGLAPLLLLIAAVIGGVLYITNMKIDLRRIGLSLSIIVVLNLLFNYGIYSFYPSPSFEDFCPKSLTGKVYETQKECEAAGGDWLERRDYEARVPGGEVGAVPVQPAQTEEYCDATASCREEYNSARDVYNRDVFMMLVSLGVLSIVAGFFAISVSAVSYGFIFGGLLSFFIGTVRYWSGMDEYLRVAVLAIVLASLVWIGYRKLKD